ncbi:MAG: hypothetical protein GX640_13470 [Fibrobacter sp.]|nr:hypothetical protein [Fibrobacter sp.]
MDTHLPLKILPQPTETTCGPTCLHAVYNYYGETLDLHELIPKVQTLELGGTLAVFLGCDALERGYNVTIYTYNLQIFDPTWFSKNSTVDLKEKIFLQSRCKPDSKLQVASNGYLKFLSMGGKIAFQDLNVSLIHKILSNGIPVITGLSATYLHQTARETADEKCQFDDLCGYPSGHFVVLHGIDHTFEFIDVADPLQSNPISNSQYYKIRSDRVICSILLGILTYDANLLIIERPKAEHAKLDSSK